MNEETQKKYELILILNPNLQEQEAISNYEEMQKNIESMGGNVYKTSNMERRRLPYPIKKAESGYFKTINFYFEPQKLEELYSSLKHKNEILRYMITVAPDGDYAAIKKEIRSIKKPKEIVEEIKTDKNIETKEKEKIIEEQAPNKPIEKKEIQLEDIDQKLDEILGI